MARTVHTVFPRKGSNVQHGFPTSTTVSKPRSAGKGGHTAGTYFLKDNYPAEVIMHTRKAFGLVARLSKKAI
jgi:hypothetical protein